MIQISILPCCVLARDTDKIASGTTTKTHIHRRLVDPRHRTCTGDPIQSGLQKLEKLNVVEELTGTQHDRVYAYKAYIAILNQENKLSD